MTDARLVDPHPRTSPRGGSRRPAPFPDELILESARRLRIACVVLALLWVIGLVMNHLVAPLLRLPPAQVIPWPPLADSLALGCIALSAAVYWIAPRLASTGDRLVTVAIGYEAAVALAIGIINQWQPLALAGRLSWLCVLILIFPSIVPGPPRKILIGSLLAASMDPVGLLFAHARGIELPPFGLLLWTYLPNYICAGLAVLPSKIIIHLGRKVSRARQLGSYRLVERIGSGGMGEVWKAEHQLLARPAAIKLIRSQAFPEGPDRVAEERFRREAEAAAGLRSPHTIQLYDFGVTRDRRLYYVMELLDGIDLESLVTRFGPQPPERVVHILTQACHSLAEAHAGGLVHRDVKPANLHLGRLGLEYDFVKVLDFGLVKREGRWLGDDLRLTTPELMAGTPAYLPPEMASGEQVDGRADIYALGCVAYFLLTGSLVFQGETAVQLMIKHLQAEPESPSHRLGAPLPPALEALVLSCLAKRPSDRPAGARELREALKHSCAVPWTQEDARRWWETSFVSRVQMAGRAPPSPVGQLLEVAIPGGSS